MFKRAVAVFVILVTVILSFAGCKGDDKDACIYFDLNRTPQSLDAQTAETDSELVIVRNIYEGLLRKDASGKIVKGVCESYKKSGNTYTFKLKENIKWSNGEKLTADDFLFAFQRAADPKTRAPFADRLFSIVGAEEIYKSGADISELGVKVSGKYTLKITLDYADPDFEETLTSSVCMPCNRAFFEESTGKYGLTSEWVISNGSYVLTRWNKEDFGIRLYRSDDYKGNFEAKNGSVFISCRNDEKTDELLYGNKVDIAFITNEESGDFTDSEVTIKSYQNKCWVLRINSEYDPDIRKAFAMLVSDRGYSDALGRGYEAASSFYPQVLGIEGASGAGIKDYNLEKSRQLFSDAVKKYEDKKFPSATLYYYDEPSVKSAVTAVVGHWQQKLSAFVNIKSANSLEGLIDDAKTDNIAFAIYPITARSGSVKEYLNNFDVVGDKTSAVEIQRQILSDDRVIPLAFENTNIGYTSLITHFESDPFNGYIDFAFITKK